MAADRRAANDALRALLSAAGWTYEALARNVNALGAENGIRLRYDRTSVAHWLAGSVPRPRTRELIAEAFTRKLRRPVPLGALGMGKSAAPDVLGSLDAYVRKGADGERRAVPLLAMLCGMDADPARRRLVQQSVYNAVEIDAPVWPGRRAESSVPERPLPRKDIGRPGGAAGLRSATDFFRRAGDFGGRHARSALVSYLHDDVVPRLHAGGPESTYLPLLAEAARLVHVLAGMYVDDVRNGAAQHYHRAARLLAAEAGDRTTYAVVLRSMSGHALDLGHRRTALRLAVAALGIATADAPPTCGRRCWPNSPSPRPPSGTAAARWHRCRKWRGCSTRCPVGPRQGAAYPVLPGPRSPAGRGGRWRSWGTVRRRSPPCARPWSNARRPRTSLRAHPRGDRPAAPRRRLAGGGVCDLAPVPRRLPASALRPRRPHSRRSARGTAGARHAPTGPVPVAPGGRVRT